MEHITNQSPAAAWMLRTSAVLSPQQPLPEPLLLLKAMDPSAGACTTHDVKMVPDARESTAILILIRAGAFLK